MKGWQRSFNASFSFDVMTGIVWLAPSVPRALFRIRFLLLVYSPLANPCRPRILSLFRMESDDDVISLHSKINHHVETDHHSEVYPT